MVIIPCSVDQKRQDTKKGFFIVMHHEAVSMQSTQN